MSRKAKAAPRGVTVDILASSLRLRPEGIQAFLDDNGMTVAQLVARMTELRFKPADVACAICGPPANVFARGLRS